MKRQFDIALMLDLIRRAVEPFPKAALFALADDGFRSPFEVLVACIISIRTRDEVMLPLVRRLFATARRPDQIVALGPHRLAALISAAGLHEAKAKQIVAIAALVEKEHAGHLPCDSNLLRSLAGVGPKCANLVLSIACHQPRVAVDVHVHKVANRWGFVATKTPEQTMAVLEGTLHESCWMDVNRLLVPFGKHICTGRLPRCSTCPVLDYCRQVGVVEHR